MLYADLDFDLTVKQVPILDDCGERRVVREEGSCDKQLTEQGPYDLSKKSMFSRSGIQ